MLGRRQDESHRAATPLELLFDLTFVAAFGVAGGELAHGIAENLSLAAVGGFAFSMVAIIWAWINFSWFASAFDTDDWLFRVLTMVQMVGVIVLAIGLPQMFASIEHGEAVANEVMVAGYVIMRVAVIAQWLRAAKGNPQFSRVAMTYVIFIGVAQLGWVALILLPLGPIEFLICAIVVAAIDWMGPIIAESKAVRHDGATPWHAHHIAERYSLLAIIALGETVMGTLAASQAISDAEGWTFSTVMVIGLGVVMTFALWWVYFLVPSAPVLAARREKITAWGYGHIVVFAAIAAVGAGLHVIAYVYDEHYHLSTLTAIWAVAIPVLVFMAGLYLLHAWLVSGLPKHAVLQAGTLALPVLGILLAAADWPLWVCLLAVVLSPVAVVVSYELGGWRALDTQVAGSIQKAQSIA